MRLRLHRQHLNTNPISNASKFIATRPGLSVFASALLLLAAAGLPAAAQASAPAPALTITSVAGPTNFAPGSIGTDIYSIRVTNTGGAPTDGSPITITDNLPSGLTLDPAGGVQGFYGLDDFGNPSQCSEGPPVTCTLSTVLPPDISEFMFVPVDVAPSLSSSITNHVSVSGGGAAAAAATETTPISSAVPGFGFQDASSEILNPDGSVDTQAGSHPYVVRTAFDLNTQSDGPNSGGTLSVPSGGVKDITANLPAGLIINPAATPVKCTEAELESELTGGGCPAASQVGLVRLSIGVTGAHTSDDGGLTALFNMVAPPGAPADLAFDAANFGLYVHLVGSVRTGGDYGLAAHAHDITQFGHILSTEVDLWGNPSDPSHDTTRTPCTTPGNQGQSCPIPPTNSPFLTLPSACSGPLATAISADSWWDPSHSVSTSFPTQDPNLNPVGITGCSTLDFSPTLTAKPDVSTADSPSGLSVDLHIPPAGLLDLNGLAEANLKRAVVTLPPGTTVNPAAADGLQACSPAQIDLSGAGPASCPEASKIGTVEVDTPLIDHPLPGAIYLAKQTDNPFGSLLAIYIAINDPQTGVVVKLAGHVVPDPSTGQLTATFDENPQLPFEDFKLSFFGGPRAPLTTPSTCGTFTTNSELTPWSAPQSGPPATPQDAFNITSGPNGSACAATVAQQPNKPAFNAGTLTPIAGSYSPFVLKLSREDGSQRIRSLDTTLPPGLTGKLAGIPYCSDAAIAAAEGASGNAEKANPSCPLASEVGTVNVGAGSGSTPLYVQGHAYLAGPYKGAPLSLAIITPAVAGPFDLGTVVVRTALYVNETTAQIHAVSDPIPSILAGIPLDVRSIALNLNRPQFTLNPTSCNAMQVLGSATSTLGQSASFVNRFQVGACGALGFKPSVALSLKGATKRNQHPALKAVVTYPKKGAYANIAKAAVTLPASEFIDNARIGDVCTRPQFAAGKCPPSSVLGKARAFTPLLDKPLEGPVYFRSNGGERELPDLVADLGGQIHVVLVGAVDAVHKKGSEVSRVRNTFAQVPDAPVSKFVLELKGGKKGLLVNSGNLCKVPNKAVVKLTAQNGKTYDTNPPVANSCGKKKHKKGRRHK